MIYLLTILIILTSSLALPLIFFLLWNIVLKTKNESRLNKEVRLILASAFLFKLIIISLNAFLPIFLIYGVVVGNELKNSLFYLKDILVNISIIFVSSGFLHLIYLNKK